MGLDEAVRKEVLRRHEIRRRKRLYLELLDWSVENLDESALASIGPLAMVDRERYEELLDKYLLHPTGGKESSKAIISKTTRRYAQANPDAFLALVNDPIIAGNHFPPEGYWSLMASLEEVADQRYDEYRRIVFDSLDLEGDHPFLRSANFFGPLAREEPHEFLRIVEDFSNLREKAHKLGITNTIFNSGFVELAKSHPDLYRTTPLLSEEARGVITAKLLFPNTSVIGNLELTSRLERDRSLFANPAEFDFETYCETLEDAVKKEDLFAFRGRNFLTSSRRIAKYFGLLAKFNLDQFLHLYQQLTSSHDSRAVEGAARGLELVAAVDVDLYSQMVVDNLEELVGHADLDLHHISDILRKVVPIQKEAYASDEDIARQEYEKRLMMKPKMSQVARGTLRALYPLAHIDPDIFREFLEFVSTTDLLDNQVLGYYLVGLANRPEQFLETFKSVFLGLPYSPTSNNADPIINASSDIIGINPHAYITLLRELPELIAQRKSEQSDQGKSYLSSAASTLIPFAETMLEDDPTPVCDEYRTMVEELLARDVFDGLTVDEIVEELDYLLDERVQVGRVIRVHEQGANQEMAHLAESAIIDIPGYQIVRYLGEGADGIVYQAEGKILGEVKIKIFKEPDERIKQAMEDEGVTLEDRVRRRIAVFDKVVRDKTYITQTYNVGRCENPRNGKDTIYTVSDYVDGGAIEVKVDGEYKIRDDITADSIPEIFRRLLLGLHAFHLKGRILKDLKLGNILLSRDHDILRIDDVETVSGLDEISAGLRLSYGSDRYAAPEVMREGPSAHSIESDIYAAGVSLLYMITGKPTLVTKINTIRDKERYSSALQTMLEQEGFDDSEIQFFGNMLHFEPSNRGNLVTITSEFVGLFNIILYRNAPPYLGGLGENQDLAFHKMGPQLHKRRFGDFNTQLNSPWYLSDSRFSDMGISPLRKHFEKK